MMDRVQAQLKAEKEAYDFNKLSGTLYVGEDDVIAKVQDFASKMCTRTLHLPQPALYYDVFGGPSNGS